MDTNHKDISAFLAKVEALKKTGGVDLSAAEDLSVAVMNLVSLEEHFFFTGAKTGTQSYFDIIQDIRSIRTRLMEQLALNHEGETWCASKHLLSSTMRLIEVGNRYNGSGEKEKAYASYRDAYRLYSIFFALKTKLIDAHGLAGAGKKAQAKGWSLEQLVEKLADCCDENTEATRLPAKALAQAGNKNTEKTRNVPPSLSVTEEKAHEA